MITNKLDFINIPTKYTRRELNALYRKIPLKDTVFRLLRKYFTAMANLYNVIPVSKAWEIISKIHPNLVTKKEFMSFAEIAVHEDEGYFIIGAENYTDKNSPETKLWSKEIVCEDLFYLGVDDYKYVKDYQHGKDYYIPSKEELLSFTDINYCNNLPEKEEFLKYLAKHCKGNMVEAADILNVAVYLDRTVMMTPNDIMQELATEFITITGAADLEEFANTFTKFHNSLKMPYNRGYSPNELSKSSPNKGTLQSITIGPNMRKYIESGEIDPNELRSQICETKYPSENIRKDLLRQINEIAPLNVKAPKVGRNDPCPCGSGKKYKKCCGK